MSRVISLDTEGKDRARLQKAIVIAVRELARQAEPGAAARDLAAFISLALKRIADGIDPSVAAWEKRGYWVKADRFRMDWAWAAPLGERLKQAVLAEDWEAIAGLTAEVGRHVGKVRVGAHHRQGEPWIGAFERLNAR